MTVRKVGIKAWEREAKIATGKVEIAAGLEAEQAATQIQFGRNGQIHRHDHIVTEEEKQDVKKTVKDLTVDDPTTPAKSDRLKKLLQKAGPAAGEILKSLISTIATAEAKKWLGIT